MRKIENLTALEIKAYEIREDLIKMLTEAKSGHSAGPLGMADVFTALYFNVMNHFPEKPWDPKRDRLLLSNGHIVPILYVTLAHAGYFKKKELATLRKLGTRLQGHPHYRSIPGIENSAGPLGQGISVAAGVAYAAKMDRRKHKVFCSLGDGELDEGQVWEAFMFSGKYKLDNLIAFVDRNHIQIDGFTDDVMPLEPLKSKFKSFNWHVLECDGHNMVKIISTFEKARELEGKPIVIIFNTTPGKGVSYMENKPEWHGKPPTKEQAEIALKELAEEESHLIEEYCKHCESKIKDCECLEGE